jgi:uncharacterized protein
LLVALPFFGVWIAPQQFLNFPARTVGFDLSLLDNSAGYWLSVALRFLRLVVVVPVMEEIFWRAFVLRFVISERFERVPSGEFTWLSFWMVTLAFTFSHSRPDWLAAFYLRRAL